MEVVVYHMLQEIEPQWATLLLSAERKEEEAQPWSQNIFGFSTWIILVA